MSLRTCCRNFSLICVLLALVILAAPAFAQNEACIQDAYNAFNGSHKTLSCTAGDVRVAAVKQGSVNVYQGGIPGTNQCIAGGSFSFTADFEILTTSSSARSNIGIFFGTGTGTNQNGALTGSCSDAILTPAYSCANGSATCGSIGSPTGYEELDQSINGETSPNGCGDTSSNDNTTGPTGFGPGTQAAVLQVTGATCPTVGTACPASTGLTGSCLALPTCTGWYQPANGMPVCNSPSHSWVPTAVPGTSSKCTCGIVYVPVTPITITPVVQKACTTATSTPQTPIFDPGFEHNPPTSPTQSPTNCAAGAEDNTVTYTVAISNPSTTSGNNAIVDQICDDKYGTVSSNFSPSTCPAGTLGTVAGSNCPPSPIAPGATGQCTFTAVQHENATVIDTVSAWGHSSLNSNSTFTNTQSNTVTVTSSDAPTTAKTNKGLEPGPKAACVTLRFDATVTNTSAADEAITLSQVSTFGQPGYVQALNDSHFMDITRTHGSASVDGSVTGTTCGVGNGLSGLGTASDLTASDYTDGGAFPKTLTVATGAHPAYTCQFDGVLCGTPGPITNCSFGLTESDTVSAHLTGDETSAPLDTITETDNQFTANVCLVQSGQ